MYFRSVFDIIFLLSVIVSVASADSDFSFLYDESGPELTSLPDDQTALSFNWWDAPLDQTSPLFDADLSSTDALDGFDLPKNVGTDPSASEIDLDDPIELADCSVSADTPNLSKLRLRRGDAASTSCSSSDGSGSRSSNGEGEPVLMLPQVFDGEKHTDVCWFATFGLLPYAVIGTGNLNDLSVNTRRTYRLGNMRVYFPTTVWHAAVLTGRVPSSIDHDHIYCCQYINTFLFVFETGVNCVPLTYLWSNENSVGGPLVFP